MTWVRIAFILATIFTGNALAEEWKVGACYKLNQRDPFERVVVEKKIVAKKGEYTQFRFYHDRLKGWGQLHSGSYTRSSYTEIPCPKSFWQEITDWFKAN
jgi:hypothetical protein